jgi:hypothetical protein
MAMCNKPSLTSQSPDKERSEPLNVPGAEPLRIATLACTEDRDKELSRSLRAQITLPSREVVVQMTSECLMKPVIVVMVESFTPHAWRRRGVTGMDTGASGSYPCK